MQSSRAGVKMRAVGPSPISVGACIAIPLFQYQPTDVLVPATRMPRKMDTTVHSLRTPIHSRSTTVHSVSTTTHSLSTTIHSLRTAPQAVGQQYHPTTPPVPLAVHPYNPSVPQPYSRLHTPAPVLGYLIRSVSTGHFVADTLGQYRTFRSRYAQSVPDIS
eukprot:1331813-Rhodomonas_salina.4